jgi:sulfite reductase alpha subunit-like flavoprotein
VLYGSQTGNAKRAAEHLARQARADGLAVRLVRADAYPTRELAAERLLYVVISTQGEGDPPDDAIGFADSRRPPRAPLPDLKYAVLGWATPAMRTSAASPAHRRAAGRTRRHPPVAGRRGRRGRGHRGRAVARASRGTRPRTAGRRAQPDVTALRPHGASRRNRHRAA